MQTLRDMRDVRSARVTQKAHEDILEAIRARDPDATRKLTIAHLQDFEKRIRRYLQSKEGSDGRSAGRIPSRASRIDRVERLRRTS
jgi:DNA-binding GntR family transcriptional regulator